MKSQPSQLLQPPIRSARSGQTLIEVMIALFVLTAGFLGILSLLSQSIFLSKTVSNETVATYLASEGIELAKNMTDHDIYQYLDTPSFGGWGGGSFDPTFPTSGDYQLDDTTCVGVGYDRPCGEASIYSGAPLRFDPTTDLYTYGGPDVTPFTRRIRVSVVSASEMVVDSIVSWNTGP